MPGSAAAFMSNIGGGAAPPSYGPALRDTNFPGDSRFSYNPLDSRGGSLFYGAPPGRVDTGNPNRQSYIDQGWKDPTWAAQNLTPGTDKGQSGFWVTPENAKSPSFALSQTGAYRGEHQGGGGFLNTITPILDIAAIAFPEFAPLVYAATAANMAEGIQNHNPFQVAMGAYGMGAEAGIVPSPAGIWSNMTGSAGVPPVGGGASLSVNDTNFDPNLATTHPVVPSADLQGPVQNMGMTGSGPGGQQWNVPENLGGGVGGAGAIPAGASMSPGGWNFNVGSPAGGNMSLGPPSTFRMPSAAPDSSFGHMISSGMASMPTSMGNFFTGPQAFKNMWNLGSGLYGLYQGHQLQNTAKELGKDPLEGQREQYAAMLSRLQNNPATIQRTPGYAAGLDAVNRSAAAGGQLGGGAGALAESTYGANLFNQRENTLANLAGFGLPGADSRAQLGFAGAGLDTMGASLNRIGNIFAQ